MIELGQLLQQTRIDQELSLADVEAETRIRQRYLEALEQGDWDALPNRAVARGFLRTYARFLKLEDHPLVQAVFVPSLTAPSPESSLEEEKESTLPPTFPSVEIALDGTSTPRRWPGRDILRFALAIIPVLILAFLLYRYALPGLLNQADAGTPVAAVATPLPPVGTPPSTPVILVGATKTLTVSPTTQLPPTYTPTPRPTATPTLEASPTPTLTPTLAPPLAPTEQITFTLKVSQLAWVRVVIDGELQLQNNLEPGAEYTFIAKQWVQMRAGNAGGVTVILNGQPLAPLGEPGEVVDYVWSISGDGIVRSTPTPEPTETPTPTETPAAST